MLIQIELLCQRDRERVQGLVFSETLGQDIEQQRAADTRQELFDCRVHDRGGGKAREQQIILQRGARALQDQRLTGCPKPIRQGVRERRVEAAMVRQLIEGRLGQRLPVDVCEGQCGAQADWVEYCGVRKPEACAERRKPAGRVVRIRFQAQDFRQPLGHSGRFTKPLKHHREVQAVNRIARFSRNGLFEMVAGLIKSARTRGAFGKFSMVGFHRRSGPLVGCSNGSTKR